MGERWYDAADASAGFEEVRRPEDVRPQHLQDVGVHFGSNGLHQVESEGIPRGLVCVKHAKTRV